VNNLRVLVVGDDPIARQELRNMLERLQVESVDKAATAVEALVQLQQRRYDLLLLDIQMPGLSGIEALKFFAKVW
jgi:CheY-like chemotaxis protein